MVFDHLLRYGWTDAVAALLDPGELPARVLRVDRGECDVITADGELRARTDRLAPCTGDWVTMHDRGGPCVDRILRRRSVIRRASASGRSADQVLAANVDTVAITMALDGDCVHRDLGRIERILALGWESGAHPVVVLTKCDTIADSAEKVARVAAIAPGAEVLAVSAATGAGLDELRGALRGTVVLIGPSGAGKSTLANALLGTDVLATNSVRSDHKGRHTTVRRELIPLPFGGQIIDTPGLRAVGLWDAGEGIGLAFADIADLASGCRFDDCAHGGEPGCAVAAAVNDGVIDPRRLDSYRKLIRENEWISARSDARLQAEQKGRARVQSRALRRMYRERAR